MNAHQNSSRTDKTSGSPQNGEPAFLVIGKLRRPHGVHGEIAMEVMTGFPERICAGKTVFVGDELQSLIIRSARPHKSYLLVGFEDINDRDEVGYLRNQMVYVQRDDRPPLLEGEFYHHEILGLSVIDEEGEYLGRITQIIETGANDVCEVCSQDGKKFLIPVIDSVVLDIDLEKSEMKVHLLPGLLNQYN